jgi:anti-sigma factor RsiW
MSDTLDRLEILIGKFLDGELSPQERSLLETELQRDRHAKELFEQMQVLHECSCGVITHEVLRRGADPADVFERAWQQNKRSIWRGIAGGGLQRHGWHWGAAAERHLRFAVGVAAGLLLGLVLRFVPVSLPQQNYPNVSSRPPVARDVPSGTYTPTGVVPVGEASNATSGVVPVRLPGDLRQIQRVVDWYVYTDQAGNQWLIEGTREGTVRPAVYRDGL